MGGIPRSCTVAVAVGNVGSSVGDGCVNVGEGDGVSDGADEAAARKVASTIVEIAAADVFGAAGAPQAVMRVKRIGLMKAALMA